MSQPEARLQRRIQDAVRARGAFVFKVHGSEYMMAGLPDLIACYRGVFIAMEVKQPGEESALSPRQNYVHQLIRNAEGFVGVITNVSDALSVLALIDAERANV